MRKTPPLCGVLVARWQGGGTDPAGAPFASYRRAATWGQWKHAALRLLPSVGYVPGSLILPAFSEPDRVTQVAT
jgi:hypothetical protein